LLAAILRARRPLDVTGETPVLRLAFFAGAVFEAGEFLAEGERHVAHRAVGLLRNDQIGFAFDFVFFLFGIGVLFDAARLAQVLMKEIGIDAQREVAAARSLGN